MAAESSLLSLPEINVRPRSRHKNPGNNNSCAWGANVGITIRVTARSRLVTRKNRIESAGWERSRQPSAKAASRKQAATGSPHPGVNHRSGLEPVFDNETVLSSQRHDVGHRADRRQSHRSHEEGVHLRGGFFSVAQPLANSPGKCCTGDAHAAQVAEWIVRAGKPRMYEARRLRQGRDLSGDGQ